MPAVPCEKFGIRLGNFGSIDHRSPPCSATPTSVSLSAARAASFLVAGSSSTLPACNRKRPVLVYFPGLKTSTALQVNTSARGATGRSPRAFVMAFAQIIKKSVL